MLTSKRIDGDYSIVATGGSGTITLQANLVSIPGDLTIAGTTTTVNTTDLNVKDNIIILNFGESGAGITLITAGVEIERGTSINAFIKFDENEDGGIWTVDQGDGVKLALVTGSIGGGGAMTDLIDDITPQVGGSGGLDMRANSITTSDLSSDIDILLPSNNSNDITLNVSNASSNIVLTAAGGNGEIIMAAPILIQGSAPGLAPASNEAALFKGSETGGGTQLHYQNDTTNGELVSKRKALMFSLIF